MTLEVSDICARWQTIGAQARGVATQHTLPIDTLVQEIEAYVDQTLPTLPPVTWEALTWQLCHNDFHLDNLLFEADAHIAAILDFDNVKLSWREVEAMLAWNLCLCANPHQPDLTDEGRAFFTAYRIALNLSLETYAQLPTAYILSLLYTTWPAAIRYASPAKFNPEWTDILVMRYAGVRWLVRNLERMMVWLTQ
jgi:Ser/Thr protein kinase RdoA (MazF antagonist)